MSGADARDQFWQNIENISVKLDAANGELDGAFADPAQQLRELLDVHRELAATEETVRSVAALFYFQLSRFSDRCLCLGGCCHANRSRL